MQQDYSNLTEYAANNIAQLKCELEKHFLELYGSSTEPIQFYSAPARINIIGESKHQIHLSGPYAVIDKYIFLKIKKYFIQNYFYLFISHVITIVNTQ